MAKVTASIEEGAIINVSWWAEGTPETDTLKNTENRRVGIGDLYRDGKWYNSSGDEIVTPLEQANKDLSNLQSYIDDMDASYREGVNSV